MAEKYEFIPASVPGVWMVDIITSSNEDYPVPVSASGDWLFTFDKKKIFNFWPDYPNKLTKEQIEIFKKAFPVMAKLRG